MPGLGQFHYSFVSNRPITVVLVTFFLPFKSLESLIAVLWTSDDIYLDF